MKAVIIFLLTCLFYSCSNSEDEQCCKCPPFDIVPSSPYDDPIWHPSGEIIGFNHTPIKEIKYTYGYDCPRQALYTYKTDSTGFWLINADGTNKRRVLPYTLNTPAWSPDGKWIGYSDNGQICIMPFDGEQFKTNNKITLTLKGSNYYPKWSNDMNMLAYISTICKEERTCGVWIYNITNKEESIIKPYGQNPEWSKHDHSSLCFSTKMIDNEGYHIGDTLWAYNTSTESISITKIIKSEPYIYQQIRNIFGYSYLYISTSGKGAPSIGSTEYIGTQLFITDFMINESTQLTQNGCISYSLSPNNKIVYTNFDFYRIDKTAGTLWTMNHDGSDKKPLTYNHFKTTY